MTDYLRRCIDKKNYLYRKYYNQKYNVEIERYYKYPQKFSAIKHQKQKEFYHLKLFDNNKHGFKTQWSVTNITIGNSIRKCNIIDKVLPREISSVYTDPLDIAMEFSKYFVDSVTRLTDRKITTLDCSNRGISVYYIQFIVRLRSVYSWF